ncbi:MAG: response regulator [Deltaproteobacteria bacterium]|nr:response regulator [Deltaproteobacteria bacterium]
MRILLVDDDDEARMLWALALGRAGHEVQQARTVAEAISLGRGLQVEVLVVDRNLPDGDGVEVVAALTEAGRPPAIALSGDDIRPDERRFAAQLVKPVALAELLACVQRVSTTVQTSSPQ